MLAKKKKLLKFIFLTGFIFFLPYAGFSDISNVTCSIQSPSPLGSRYNSGQTVTLKADWRGDSPNFSATFKVNGLPVGTSIVSVLTTDLLVPTSSLKEGDNNFGVSVLEIPVANSTAVEANAPGNVFMDRIAPTITVSIISGNVVSPNTGYDEVVFQVSSNEGLGEPPTITVSPGTWNAPTPVFPEIDPYINGQYKLKVPSGTSGGAYSIRAVGRDKTEPAATRNEGSAQAAFTVDASADGSPTINSSVPVSPIRTESIKLSGTIKPENGVQKIEVLASGAVVATTDVPANTDSWSVSFSIDQGAFSYSARRTDPLGNVSPTGTPITIVCDRTPPSAPVLVPPKTPVSETTIKVTGTGVLDPPYNSGPLKLKLLRDGSTVGTATANIDGTFTFENVLLVAGNNLFVAQAADTTNDSAGGSTGNTTSYSNAVTVVLDQTKPVVVSGGLVISSPAGPTMLVSPVSTSHDVVADQPPEDSIFYREESEKEILSNKKFEPPLSDFVAGKRSFQLPLNSIVDQRKTQVQVWFLYSSIRSRDSSENSIQMTRTDSVLSATLPPDLHESIAYRFLLRDKAGNVSYFPPSGVFTHLNIRTPLLRLSISPEPLSVSEGADEWPVEVLGMPPRERILSYRRIYVHPLYIPEVQRILSETKQQGIIILRDLASAQEAPPGYEKDLELLKTQELPLGREDLLIHEIKDEIIPANLLPDPKTLSEKYRKTRDTILFRLLHESNH